MNVPISTPKVHLPPRVGLSSGLAPEKNIPNELDDIVMKALEKKPANRFQTMQEMLDAVRLLDSAYTLQVLRKLENQDQ